MNRRTSVLVVVLPTIIVTATILYVMRTPEPIEYSEKITLSLLTFLQSASPDQAIVIWTDFPTNLRAEDVDDLEKFACDDLTLMEREELSRRFRVDHGIVHRGSYTTPDDAFRWILFEVNVQKVNGIANLPHVLNVSLAHPEAYNVYWWDMQTLYPIFEWEAIRIAKENLSDTIEISVQHLSTVYTKTEDLEYVQNLIESLNGTVTIPEVFPIQYPSIDKQYAWLEAIVPYDALFPLANEMRILRIYIPRWWGP